MTLKDINFSIAMYGTTPISQSTYEVGYTGDESSINVKFTVTDEADLSGATAKLHLYFADSSHIVRDMTLTGLVFNYTLVGTENDHAGVVRADIIITKSGAKYTRAGHRFRIDTSLEASAPLVEYAIDTLDTLVDGAEEWLLQAQTDFGTAQSQRADEWVADNDTRSDEFTAAQTSRAETFTASEADRTSTFNTNETGRSNTFTTNENARQGAYENAESVRDELYATAEANRDSQFDANESARATAETARLSAESARVAAELARVTEYTALASDLTDTLAAADANIENFDIALQNGIIGENIAAELQNLETTYAPDLFTVKQQLEQTKPHAEIAFAKNIVINPINTTKTYMTIIDDDGRTEVWDKLKPISDDLGVPFTIAIPVRNNETVPAQDLTKEQLLSLQALGWEIASHSYTHTNLRPMTETQLEHELGDSKKELESWGLRVRNFVAPYGSNDVAFVREMASRYYNCGAIVGGGVNIKPVKNQNLYRVALGSYTAVGENTLEFYKSKVDEAIAKKGWLIFMTHAWNADHDATQNQYLRDVIAYAQSLNVDIVNMQEGFEAMGNVLEVEGVATLRRDGTFRANNIPSHFTALGEVTQASLPSYFFEKYMSKVVYSDIRTIDAQSFPEASAGTLITYSTVGKDGTWQEWIPYRKNSKYIRYSTNNEGTAWSDWSPWTNYKDNLAKYTGTNTHTNDSLIGEFEAKKISYTSINSSGATGFPYYLGGLLITNRIQNEVGVDFQEFRGYNTNKIYTRYLKTDGSWSSWVGVATKKTLVFASQVVGTVLANSYKDITLDCTSISPLLMTDNVVINPRDGLTGGLGFNSWVFSSTQVVLRVFNYTPANVVCGVTNWHVEILNN